MEVLAVHNKMSCISWRSAGAHPHSGTPQQCITTAIRGSWTLQRTSVDVEAVLQDIILVVHQVIAYIYQVLIHPEEGQELGLRQLLSQAKQQQI